MLFFSCLYSAARKILAGLFCHTESKQDARPNRSSWRVKFVVFRCAEPVTVFGHLRFVVVPSYGVKVRLEPQRQSTFAFSNKSSAGLSRQVKKRNKKKNSTALSPTPFTY